MRIERLAHADLAAVIAIERRSYPTPWSMAMFVLEQSKRSSICLVARDADDAVVGYLICSRYDTVWHVMNVCVDPGHRRRGVATAMIERLLLEVPEPDGARFTLEVRVSNAGALELYRRLGFARAGTRRRYYQDNGEDAIVMWRTPATLSGSLHDVPNAELPA